MSTDTTEVDDIDELALDIERTIAKGKQILEDIPDYEDRRTKNSVQLRKVVEGDIDGVVMNDR